MLAFLTLLRPLLPWLAGLLILGGIWGWGYQRGASSVQHKFDAYVIEQREVMARTAAAWNAERAAHEIAILRDQENRYRTFAALKDRAHALPPALNHIVVPPVARQLLDDAIAAAQPAGSAPEPATPAPTIPDTTLAEVTQWGVEAAAWAAMCRDRVHAWESFYNGLREAH